jgi:sensor histidine kinase YesM
MKMGRVKREFNEAILYHLLVVMLLLVPHAIYTIYIARVDIKLYFWNIIVIDGLLLFMIYINLYYLIPVYHREKRYVRYFILLGMLVGIFIYASHLMDNLIQKELKYPDEPIIYFIVSTAVKIVQYLLFSFFLFNLKEKYEQKRLMNEIQMESLRTEINYLRSQINPHFLFNTLNNLYGLALEKSDKAPEIIMRLSKIMDYMLYESEDATVYLKYDIENLRNYIEIERIRQGNNAVINFKQTGLLNSQKIVPLLLLPLVENGFKHGINKQIKNAFLDIHVFVAANSVKLSVTNNYKASLGIEADSRNGIGLNNLRRRLQLFYPNKHELITGEKESKYEAQLKISLS